MAQGFVYILVSPNSSFIKIGGTERPIAERIRGINAAAGYSDLGPWQLSDFMHVTDWRLVENGLHRHFKGQTVLEVERTRELFRVPAHDARIKLRLTQNALRVGHDKTLQIFKNKDAGLFLFRLFQLSGLFGSIDLQGAWSLSLLPQTNGGRWFTLNIGSHEVAFSTKERENTIPTHFIVLDRLILEYPETIMWIGKRDGEVRDAVYRSAERAVVVSFRDDFAGAERFFALSGVRRAMIAYWSESLADLRQRNAKSTYARYHSYDAVSELLEYKNNHEKIFSL